MPISKQEAVIAAKLLVEDQSTAALNHIKKGFEDVDKAHKNTKNGMNFFKSTLGMFTAVNLMPAAHQVYNFGKSFIEAAAQVEQADRAITTLQMANQRTGWSDTIKQTKEIRRELDNVALASGVARIGLDKAFQSYLTMEGASEKNVSGSVKMMGEFANIATRTGMDINKVASEFAMMEEGIFRARGTMFQLLHTTGIFGDKVHGASTQWAKLTQESRHDQLVWAIERINRSLEETPKTAEQLFNTLQNITTIKMQHLGEGFLTGVTPALTHLVNTLLNARGELDRRAEDLGIKLGELFGKILIFVEEKVEYIQAHWDEIASSIRSAWSYAKEVVEFIIAHKEAIAATYVGTKIATSSIGAAAIVPAVTKGVSAVADAGVSSTANYLAMSAALALPTLAKAGLIGVGIAGISGIFYAANELYEGTKKMKKDDVDAIKDYFEKLKSTGDTLSKSQTEQIKQLRDNLMQRALDGDQNAKSALDIANSVQKQNKAAAETRKSLENQAEIYRNTKDFMSNYKDVVGNLSTGIADSLGSKEQTLDIASLIIDKPQLESAFAQLNTMTMTQLDQFLDILQLAGPAFSVLAFELQAKLQMMRNGTNPPPKSPLIGTAHFHMKQEFRDADPDRVAIAFKRDIERAVSNRLNSPNSMAY